MFDAVTGLQWNINRWYDPKIGRWISEDPIGFWASDANLNRYVGNDPQIAIDLHGNKAFFLRMMYQFTHSSTPLMADMITELKRIFNECTGRYLSAGDTFIFSTMVTTSVPGTNTGEISVGPVGCNTVVVYAKDSNTGVALGVGNSYQLNLNSSRIETHRSAFNPQPTSSDTFAMVIAHEIWESFNQGSHAGPGYIDSDPGKIGGAFSHSGCEDVCKTLGIL